MQFLSIHINSLFAQMPPYAQMPSFAQMVVGSPSWVVPCLIAGVGAALLVLISYWRTSVSWKSKAVPATLKFIAFSLLLFCVPGLTSPG